MNLLFHTDTNFSKQFKELLGFVDADLRFINLKSKLITATQEFIDLVGQEVYDSYVTAYLATPDNPSHKVYLAQYAIGLNAYRLHAPNSDLMHSNNGRASRKTDKQGVAFEWMLERNDKQLERDYYKAIDQVLEFLETEKSAIWLASSTRSSQNQYFVNTTKDFEEFFPIESRLLLIKLQPGIRKNEREQILPRLGVAKYDAYKTLILGGNGITTPLLSVYKLVQEAVVYYALAWGMSHLTAQLFPEGVLQKYSSDRMTLKASKVPEQLQSQLAEQKFTEDANRIMLLVEKMLEDEAEANQEPLSTEPLDFKFGFDETDNFVDA